MPNGILLALIAYASYSCNDAVVKSLGGQFTVFEIGFFSTLFSGCFLLFTRPNGERWRDFWRTNRPWAVQTRAWAGIASGVLSVYAFTTIPLAEVYALIFLAPLLVTILSTVILKEKVGPGAGWRWSPALPASCWSCGRAFASCISVISPLSASPSWPPPASS
ncbi:EamA family transporter [Mesorhizobium amorphae]